LKFIVVAFIHFSMNICSYNKLRGSQHQRQRQGFAVFHVRHPFGG
jgi:hypothetical protein